ncbi:unnamed protein product [Thlaspi arvense]|uniref:Uncharacterized protein n=1 Tax=Thlaspi arvense TaxID=13288 RepID=A0AAU9SY06_THLAR|nr:unnamed protein product [Thlaspi arvense]
MDLTWLSALIVGAALGFCIGTRRSKPVVAVERDSKNQLKGPLEIEKLADILDDFKMVLYYICHSLPLPLYVIRKTRC